MRLHPNWRLRRRLWRSHPIGGYALATVALAVGGACGGEAFDDSSGGDSGSESSSSTSSTNGSGGTTSSGSSSTNETSSTGTTTGSTSSTNGSGGGSSSSSSGGTGGAGSTSVGSGGSGGGTGGSGGGAGGSGGGPSDLCRLPIVAGNCDAYFPAYAFNAATGLCESFVYGGCGGNDNRFDTLEECLAACDRGGRTACGESSECVINQGCCGYCGIESVDDFEAVNQVYADYNDLECQVIDCDYCEPPENAEQFGARCNAGSCEVFDVRQSAISECTSSEDCRLRSGLGCCEGCVDGNWVAVSADYELVLAELCGSQPVACPACAPVEPQGLEAICGAEGHCIVSELD